MAEWDNEPDYETFVHLGFKCEIKRYPESGFLCGYVHVPQWNWAYGEDGRDLKVHGGITYSERVDDSTVGDMAESMGVGSDWILGFDCNHYRDYAPGIQPGLDIERHPENYKNIAYVRRELEGLCLQLSRPRSGS